MSKMTVVPLTQIRSNGVNRTQKRYIFFIYDYDVVKYGLNMVKTHINSQRWPH